MKTKDKVLAIRVSEDDRRLIAQRARDQGLSQSEYVLQTLLGAGRAETGLSKRLKAIETRLYQLEHEPRNINND